MVLLSTYELEETVSIMVKWSQAAAEKIVKPSWWPVDYQFPLKRHSGMNVENWREILHSLISKCYQFNNRERLRSKRLKPNRRQHNVRRNSGESSSTSGLSTSNGRVPKRKMTNNNIVSAIVNGRMRRDSIGSSASSTVSSLSGGNAPMEKEATATETGRNKMMCSGLVRPRSGDSSTSHSEISVAEELAKKIGLPQKYPDRLISPIVQVYDVCKVKPSFIQFDNNNIKYRKNENCDVIKRDIDVAKNDYMNYFGLDMKSDSVMLPKNDELRNTVTKTITCKNNLVNCPHVPFSSNVGLKLIKEWHHYDIEVIEKRLERLERFLCNSDLPALLTPIKDEFKVLNNKNSNSRAMFGHFYKFPTKKRHREGKLTPKARFLLKNYCKPCTVNLSTSGPDVIKKYFNSRKAKLIAIVDLANAKKEKENKTPFILLESRVVLTSIDKFKENNSTCSSSLVKKVGPHSNLALQTLAPRNENSVQPPTKIKRVNFINPSVVLQPIHELFEFTKRDKILHSAHKIARPPYKVVKTRVNVYNPRRFSTRLQEVINV